MTVASRVVARNAVVVEAVVGLVVAAGVVNDSSVAVDSVEVEVSCVVVVLQ